MRVRVGQIVRLVTCSVVVHVLIIGYRVSLVVVCAVEVCVTGGGIIVDTETLNTVVVTVCTAVVTR